VTCQELDALLNSRTSRSTASTLPTAAAEHIAVCERCGRLVRVLQGRQPVEAPSAQRLRQIESALLRDLKPVQPILPGHVFLALLSALFVATVAMGSLLLGVAGWSALSAGQRTVVFAVSAAGGALLAVSMVRQMFPGSRHAISPARLLVAVLAVLTVVEVALFRPQRELAFVSDGLMCLRIGVSYAIPAGFVSWLVLRRGAMLSPKLTGATAGTFAGLIGVTVLEVYCPNLNLFHILVWHFGVIVLSALAGLIIGSFARRAPWSPRAGIEPIR
jgi:hypothetical protein